MKSVPLGGKVTQIGSKAFYQCTSLNKITIPAATRSIGAQAFYNCRKLKNLTIKTRALNSKTIGKKAFTGIYSKVIVKVPKKVFNSYKKLLKAKGVGGKAVYKKF